MPKMKKKASKTLHLESSPMDKSVNQHAHLEMSDSAPKIHVGQKVTAKVHGVVSEVATGYAGKGHRVRIAPTQITYTHHRGEKSPLKEQMKKVRVAASSDKKRY